MIRRNKFYKKATVTLAIMIAFGSNLQYIYGYEKDINSVALSQYVDGVYELNTTLKHESKDENSMANTYLTKSEVEINNSKMYMLLTFKSGNMIKEVNPTVNGNSIEAINTLNGDIRTIKFEIPSIDSSILLNVKINPFGDMVVNANCIVETEFKQTPQLKPEEKPETDLEESPQLKPEDESDNNTETTPEETPDTSPEIAPETGEVESTTGESTDKEESTTEYKNGYYTLKNVLKLDNSVGYSMVRNLLNETMTMEVKNGKTYITFEMSGSSMMNDIKVQVDGKTVPYEQTSIGNDTLRFKIEVPSVDSNITMSMYVYAMGKTTEFEIALNKSTIEFISSNEAPSIPSNDNATNSTTGESTTEDTTTSTEKIEEVVAKGKLYTIKNNVISDSSTGKEMARKYLNSTSKIEEIDGKYYATLTFTGASLMKNHKIYVNGSKVSHQIVAKSSDSISIRFAIPSINADIKVGVHVIPVGMDISFGVELLENTLTFVKEFDTTSSTLPQTGSVINNQSMMMAGSLLATSGLLSRIKKRK